MTDAGQEAIKALADVRRRIVVYREKEDGPDDVRTHHAKTASIGEVVGELMIDIHNMDVLAETAGADTERAITRAKKAEEDLAEAKRPFTAQMEMQNKRIIGLNGQLEVALERALTAEERAERLEKLINTPELEDFDKGVSLECAHQVARWGEAHDRSKSAENWYWLIGYLAGKALRAAIAGERVKALHHTISAAAALRNWHAAIKRDRTGAGIGEDPDLVLLDAGVPPQDAGG